MKLIPSQLFPRAALVSVLMPRVSARAVNTPRVFMRKGAFENVHLTLILAVCCQGYTGRYFHFAFMNVSLFFWHKRDSVIQRISHMDILAKLLSIDTRASVYLQTVRWMAVDGYFVSPSNKLSFYKTNVQLSHR